MPDGAKVQLKARGLVNATGPWVKRFLDEQTHIKTTKRVRLIKGSHIIVPRLHEGDHAFILQNSDHRIVFIIPYERDFSCIGTTDITVEAGEKPVCTPEETAYLCEIASHYMVKQVTPADVVWTYSGVRPLFDDGDDNPSAVTRDYHLEVDGTPRASGASGVAPLLSVFGGKITTYRRLAEHALKDLAPYYPHMGLPWTATRAVADGELADAPTFEEAFDTLRRERRLGEARPAQGTRARALPPARLRAGRASRGRHDGGRSRPPFRRLSLRDRGPLPDARRMGGRARGRAVAADQGRPAHERGPARGFRPVDGRTAAQLRITKSGIIAKEQPPAGWGVAIAYDQKLPSSRAKPPEGRRSRGTSLAAEATERSLRLRRRVRSAPVGMTEVFAHMR